ncbi:MAG TPA: hypothetical protein VL025_08090 [Thermoanaerobaculia bacterium]|nr:hypothetical protein [Thermoanaerobaculia bacterium]
MTEHPTPATLTDFLLGRLTPAPASAVITHLLHGCERCQEVMEPLATAILSARGFEQALAPEEEDAYDGAISGACRKVLETLREERAKTPGRAEAAILSRFSETPRRASAPAPRSASR